MFLGEKRREGRRREEGGRRELLSSIYLERTFFCPSSFCLYQFKWGKKPVKIKPEVFLSQITQLKCYRELASVCAIKKDNLGRHKKRELHYHLNTFRRPEEDNGERKWSLDQSSPLKDDGKASPGF